MRARRILSILLLGLGFFMGACGYSRQRGQTQLGGVGDGGDQRIFIPVVDNQTVRTGFESEITTALRETLAEVPGLEIVESADRAQYLLLASVIDYTRDKGPSPKTGSGSAGGLRNGSSTAGDISFEVGLRIRLLEATNPSLKRVLWDRSFSASTLYETSRRFVALERDLDGGSSSAPHINYSRERVQLKSIARRIARQVVDQVVQDF